MEKPYRTPNRLQDYDYSQPGAFFVTICTQGRRAILSKILVGTFKRFCNKEYGSNIWQSRYYDHVIRNQQDYNEVWEYIENNPTKWAINKDKI